MTGQNGGRQEVATAPPDDRREVPEGLDGWLSRLASRQPVLGELLRSPTELQDELGYGHTLREVCQQPLTWRETATRAAKHQKGLQEILQGCQGVVLTGSGSSEYAGNCLDLVLQRELGVPAEAINAGRLLTHGRDAILPSRPALLVSLARSGDSPESTEAVDVLLESDKGIRHLVITCNRRGRLATNYVNHPRVHVMALHDATCDRSLAMTSSFTNMVLAGRFLGLLNDVGRYQSLLEELSAAAEHILLEHTGAVAKAVEGNIRRAVYLGSGARAGAVRETALKMLEMTSGRVMTLAETPLGLRHGPMCSIDAHTLVVGFLSSDPLVRAYEVDVFREIERKRLGVRTVIFGENVPAELSTGKAVILECPGLGAIGDDSSTVLNVLIGQLLAFFRCRAEGLRPDSPSEDGVISRVVGEFTLHRRPNGGVQ